MTAGLRIRVRGQVQGVGFRPFVWQLAHRFDIRGEVLNDPEGVLILAHGASVDPFVDALSCEAPPLAHVDAVEIADYRFDTIPADFVIAASVGQGAQTRVTPDAATCDACCDDIRGDDPRRRGYAFTNCTHCGPRFTILNGLPYDRARTTMAAFAMCADCAAEYGDPADRRFHAQPVACSVCGPTLWFEDGSGRLDGDALSLAVAKLKEGAVLAIKGLGGFHLCCDGTNPDAVAALRARKRRPTKPLALMGTEAHIARYARPSKQDWLHLRAPSAPIVLMSKGAALPDVIAPSQNRLGWMLPYTALHHLLLDKIAVPLVMTSGNLSGEPQVIDNDEARTMLADIVDGFVMHDRDIARRLDDSVLQTTRHGTMILRRARGLVPETLPLPAGFEDAPQTVAYGAHLKSAICLIKDGQALLSHHLGDLDDALTWDEFVKADADYAQLFDHQPEIFACDLHPGYRSSQHAAERGGDAVVEVQHHHAHLAACLAETGWPRKGGRVAGIVLDGLGLGSDGTIWGGEVLLGDYVGVERRAWLRPAPLPGGDAANRAPWRNLLARLDQAGMVEVADDILNDAPRALLRQAVERGVNAPLSSSAGRLFDAFAAALGVEGDQSFEGEAAMKLEAMAQRAPLNAEYAYPFADGDDGLDPAPMWDAWLGDQMTGTHPEAMAMRFHAGLAQAFAAKARALVISGEAQAVALSGGCFQNALLLELTVLALGDVPLLLHEKVPANDGGLALGQAVIAAAQALARR
ncbi:carbamoyltransferase HypF [Litoreibacter roseus]|uniref:Carbamoyltransferase HypF n=1 Tax=Litoreibacter roseus TaxID=2601869 RepID=A0A6N6JD45_9RHOB|nr:carbamoyltransferase HypF [Litoreibacter roseus]